MLPRKKCSCEGQLWMYALLLLQNECNCLLRYCCKMRRGPKEKGSTTFLFPKLFLLSFCGGRPVEKQSADRGVHLLHFYSQLGYICSKASTSRECCCCCCCCYNNILHNHNDSMPYVQQQQCYKGGRAKDPKLHAHT